MSTYAIWNTGNDSKTGILTFQIAREYAHSHPEENVLVIDMTRENTCAATFFDNDKSTNTDLHRTRFGTDRSLSGYIDERISSPYRTPRCGAEYLTKVNSQNGLTCDNLYLVRAGDKLSEQSSHIKNACNTNMDVVGAWRSVHMWIGDMITDTRFSWNKKSITVFVVLDSDFTILTELGLCVSDYLIVPFVINHSCENDIGSILSFVYGFSYHENRIISEFYRNVLRERMIFPAIHSCINVISQQKDDALPFDFENNVDDALTMMYTMCRYYPQWFCFNGKMPPSSIHEFKDIFETRVNIFDFDNIQHDVADFVKKIK